MKVGSNVRYRKLVLLVLIIFVSTYVLSACKKNDTSDSPAGSASVTKKSETKTTSGKTSAKASTTKNTTTTNGTPSDADNNDDDVEPGTLPEDDEDDAEEDLPPETAEKTIDLQGKDFVVAIRVEAIKRGQSEGKDVLLDSWEAAEKKFNFNLVWKEVLGGSGVFAAEYLKYLIAGIHFADTIHIATKMCFPTWAEEGFILPIDDYIDFTEFPFDSKACETGALYRGKHYGFGPYFQASGYGVFFNRDIFVKEALPDLHDLVETNTWTWDKMLELALIATRDMNGDGVIDQWGITSHHPLNTCQALIYSNGTDVLVENPETHNIEFYLNNPKALRALQFFDDLHNTHKVVLSGSKFNNFRLAKSAMHIGTSAKYISGVLEGQVVDAGFTFMPKGPDTDEFSNVVEEVSFYAYPATVQNLDEVVEIMKYATVTWDPNKPEYYDPFQEARNNFALYMKNPRDVEFMMSQFSDTELKPLLLGFEDRVLRVFADQLCTPLSQNKTTPSSAVEAITPQVWAIINETIKNNN